MGAPVHAEYLHSGMVDTLTSALGGRLQRSLLQNLLSIPSKREGPLHKEDAFVHC